MKPLTSEILRLFPEIEGRVFDGDEELSHQMMSHLADWVIETTSPETNKNIIPRIKELQEWCQKRNDNGEDYTVFIVSLYETLCENKKTHPLVPPLTPKSEFRKNKDYLVSWIGQKNYNEILENHYK